MSEAETQFLVKHIWEMQGVTFPYYFVSDNCAYRLLGLLDLVRPELNLASKFKHASIPAETIKAVEKQGLTAQTVYRPALETQLLAQARQHGHALSADAHALAFAAPSDMAGKLALYNETDRAKMLEMAYDDLYLYFTSRKVKNDFAQPRLRQLLVLRSQIDLAKQRQDVPVPAVQPHEGHHARNIYVQSGEVQGESFVALGGRAAYHDLIDPQGGYRIGTQLKFMDGAVQYRQSKFDVEHLDVLAVNSYSPVTAFKTPLSWGFNLGWQQEALDSNGKFSAAQQHGVANLNVQAGYSWANADRTQLCYAQFQTMLQGSKALDLGWRAGAGPVAGCQSVWSDHWGSTFSAALPYWQDSHEWNVRLNAQLQYQFNAQHALRLGAEYQQQAELEWKKLNFGYYYYY